MVDWTDLAGLWWCLYGVDGGLRMGLIQSLEYIWPGYHMIGLSFVSDLPIATNASVCISLGVRLNITQNGTTDDSVPF